VVPDLECCVAFEFGEDPVGCANAVMSCLEDRGNCFWNAEGEYK
jgi:hypothetical protein